MNSESRVSETLAAGQASRSAFRKALHRVSTCQDCHDYYLLATMKRRGMRVRTWVSQGVWIDEFERNQLPLL